MNKTFTHEFAIKIRINCRGDDDAAFDQVGVDLANVLHGIRALSLSSNEGVVTTPIAAEFDLPSENLKCKFAFRRIHPHNYSQFRVHEYEANKEPATEKQKLYIESLCKKSLDYRMLVELEAIMQAEGAEGLTKGITKGQASYLIACLTYSDFVDEWDSDLIKGANKWTKMHESINSKDD